MNKAVIRNWVKVIRRPKSVSAPVQNSAAKMEWRDVRTAVRFFSDTQYQQPERKGIVSKDYFIIVSRVKT